MTDAYNAARTPQIDVTYNTNTVSTLAMATAQSGAGALQNTPHFHPSVMTGAVTQITLPAASKSRRVTSSTTGAASSQPIATVTLTYDQGYAGQMVWVQARRGGTLSATDSGGQTYDGSQGFFLTIDANGSVTFNYQAPDASGLYPVFTRFSNVMTTLPFVVPDTAP